MSADNWAVCPRCDVVNKQRLEQFDAQIAAAYGKVTIGEFEQLRAERTKMAQKFSSVRASNTLREDYEVYTDEVGVFVVSYSASCGECGFDFDFDHSKQLDVTGG